MNEFYINNNNLKLNIITHEMNEPQSILIHLHGLGSHFQYIYSYPNNLENRINILSKYDILSYALEFQGHGKSEGDRCKINKYTQYIDNLHTLVKYIRNIYHNLPIFILGESMGGAVAILYTLKYPDTIKGIILLSPMCGITQLLNRYWITIKFLLYLSYLIPSRKLIYFNNYNNMHSIEYMKSCNNCIYLNKEPIRLDTGRECYYMVDSIKNNSINFTCNVLAYHSLTDSITSPESTQDFINTCSSTNKELILLKKGDHSILLPINGDNPAETQPISILKNIGMWINNI